MKQGKTNKEKDQIIHMEMLNKTTRVNNSIIIKI